MISTQIRIFNGPIEEFYKLLPDNFKSIYELILESDKINKTVPHVVSQNGDSVQIPEIIKEDIENLVVFSDSYANISESGIQGLINILSNFNIENMYIQNPPLTIERQLMGAYADIITFENYNYQKLSLENIYKIYDEFSNSIVGQDKVKDNLLPSLYSLIDSTCSKPLVILLNGPSGVGKTETAKFLSDVLGQEIFRKQFSMLNNNEFGQYIFGGEHNKSSFAMDLLNRSSNIILLDEFDKCHTAFHNAFYQLFDEGIFEDKNYTVKLNKTIIICTSNYNCSEDARKHLGDPIFFRFDKTIQYEDLSQESIKIIIERIIESKFQQLNSKKQAIVNRQLISDFWLSNSDKLVNVRQISNLIENDINSQIVSYLIKNRDY